MLHRHAAAGVVADRTGLTVTYTDVTGHSTSLRYHFPVTKPAAEFRGTVTSILGPFLQVPHCNISGSTKVRVGTHSYFPVPRLS